MKGVVPALLALAALAAACSGSGGGATPTPTPGGGAPALLYDGPPGGAIPGWNAASPQPLVIYGTQNAGNAYFSSAHVETIAQHIHTDRARSLFRDAAENATMAQFEAKLRQEAAGEGIQSCPFADSMAKLATPTPRP